ncbi:anti-sigma factor [Streptomyces sp. NPDC126514]|uniref:anti-sigma factor n=1 Tax=Streptomyces sp. NPDC126514 TaxID=3155210 RepID=UPI003319DE9D
MEHTDEAALTLMALGDPPSPDVTQHLLACSRCRQELQALRRVAAHMRAPSPTDGDLLEPPADLWDAIADELNLSTPDAERTAAPGTPPFSLRSRDAIAPGRRRRLARFTIGLAACAALLGAAAGSAVTWWATQSTTAAPSAEEGNRLRSLQANSAGYASLSDSDGHRTLEITVKGLPSTAGYFEVWLMDRTHTKLISMGVLGPDGHATLPVPGNVDLREYSEVDVSVQPYNGKPDHSGDSVVRGPYAG